MPARFPAEMFPGLLERPFGYYLYELLGKHYETARDEAGQHIDLVNATVDEAQIVEVPIGSPLLSTTRATMDTKGRKIEFAHDLFRGDRTQITVRTKGHPATLEKPGQHGRTVELKDL